MDDFSCVSTSPRYMTHRVSAAYCQITTPLYPIPDCTEQEIRKEQLRFYNIAHFPRLYWLHRLYICMCPVIW